MRLLDLTFSTAQAARIMKVANRPGGVIHTDIVIHLKADAEQTELSRARHERLIEPAAIPGVGLSDGLGPTLISPLAYDGILSWSLATGLPLGIPHAASRSTSS